MTKIKVRNFGPIKEGFINADDWIEIKKVTVFIGDQGTGKSTLAKIISTFTWIEKALTRGDYPKEYFNCQTIYRYLDYHNILNYVTKYDLRGDFGDDFVTRELLLHKNTTIEYQGESYYIHLNGYEVNIKKMDGGKYHLPKIMYMPSERTFLSYIEGSRRYRGVSKALVELSIEFRRALMRYRDPIVLPLKGVTINMNDHFEQAYIKGKDFVLPLDAASSGFQSLAPLYVVSRSLALSVKKRFETDEEMTGEELERFSKDIAAIHANTEFTEEQRRAALSVVAKKYNKSAFINIVEEPEQNLFPSSQWDILKSLLEFNNMSAPNELIMTSHSPYIINYLMLAVKAKSVYQSVEKCAKEELLPALEEIVPSKSTVNPDEIEIYEIDENGKVLRLPDYNGLPSDENYLNQLLEESNIMYSKLLDIEEQCQ